MEFSTATTPPVGGYKYKPRTVITLIGHEKGPNSRRGSQASGGRRPSFGAADPETGGGLRRISSIGLPGRRASMSAKEAKAEMLRDPNAPAPAQAPMGDSAVVTEPKELERTRSKEVKESKNGKWVADTEAVVTSTHVIIVIPAPATLQPWTPEPAESITSKIKSIFTPSSSTAAPAAKPPPATNGQLDMSYPGHINGQTTTHITVPLGAIKEDGVKIVEEKNEVGVVVPVNEHFSGLVHPMLDDLGQNHDDTWARSGSIKFSFPKEWIGAKAEAEVLHHAIVAAIEHRKTGGATDRRLSFGVRA